MYKIIQFILFSLILLNLFVFDMSIGNVSLSTILVLISWCLFFLNSILHGLKYKKEYILLLIFYSSLFIISLTHRISMNNILFLVSTISTVLYIGPIHDILLIYRKQLKYIFLSLFVLYITHFIFNYQIGTREYESLVFNIINGFSYTILYFAIILILLSKQKVQFLIVFISFIVIVLTFSRGPLILMLIGVVIYLISKKKLKPIIFLASLVLVSSIILIYFGFSDVFYSRLRSIYDTDVDSSTIYRVSVFIDGIKHLRGHFWGTGFESFSNYFWQYSDINYTSNKILPIDNSFILLIFSSGIIPLIILFILIFRLYCKRNLYLSIAITIFLGHMFFDDAIISPRFLFLMIVIIALTNAFKYDYKTME